MTERPILFNAPMVRALLSGTKTQTRRIVKGAPDDWAPIGPEVFSPTTIDRHGDEQPGRPEGFGAGNADGDCWIRCPYGQPGDRLWVREAFIHEPADYCWEASVSIPCRPATTVYRADHLGDTRGAGWSASIHMPRALSRITLEVTGVRVERLQDISEADAQAEGIERSGECNWRDYLDSYNDFTSARRSYRSLWESINGPGSWDANPWVWCVEFQRIDAVMGEKP